MQTFWVIAGIYVAMSIVTALAYAVDKRAATRGTWRVSERSLHFMELLGGWPGALVASRMIRHKSKKKSYRAVLGLIIVLHVVVWGLIVWLLVRGNGG
ncbi:MAG: DUF1294 domain-containing protein [Planctomycetota bacterium]|nr:DUF1294 domain-containing protein [Planctomycetota bacterium]